MQLNYIDTTQVDALSGGDLGFKTELINIFLEQIPDFVSQMKTALNEQNWELLAREAHTAKSSALTFGMDKTGHLLKDIQLLSEKGELEKLPELVQMVNEHLNAASEELQQVKASL